MLGVACALVCPSAHLLLCACIFVKTTFHKPLHQICVFGTLGVKGQGDDDTKYGKNLFMGHFITVEH